MTTEELIATVRQNRDPLDGPGAIVGIIRNRCRSIVSAGLADLENPAEITAETSFHVASLAKQFTAFLVATLAAEGRVDLDGRVGDYLDWLRPPTSDCTLRQLILHTAGLRDHWALAEFAGLRDGDSITTIDACRWIAAQSELNFPSGTRFLYSNSGYVLLARVVEAIEGVSFAKVADRRIFAPLGMTGTFVVDDPGATFLHRARGYVKGGDGWMRCEPNYGVVGATCLRTNARDMIEWLSTKPDDPFFSNVASVGYFKPGALDDGSPIRYGFGQIHTALGDRPVILHGGFDYGFNAISIRDRENGDALFATSNGSTPAIEGAAMGLVASWASGTFHEEPGAPDVSSAEFAPLPGTYVRDDLTDLRVIRNVEGSLKIFWNQEMALAPAGKGRWTIVGTPVIARPEGNRITFSNGHDEVTLTRVKDASSDAAELDGTYICDTLNSLMLIGTEGKKTTLTIGRSETHELEAVNDELFVFGSNWLTVERDRGKVTALRLFQMRCAGVVFKPLGA